MNYKGSNKTVVLILSFLWFWMALVYHVIYFTAINKAAYFFSALFVIQGLLFLRAGVFKKEMFFKFEKNIHGILGMALIAYALIIYPLLGFGFGHVYPYSPTFGLPCPTTIFTLGILLWTKQKSFLLLIIPFTWSLIGFSAALFLGIYEDIALLIAGLLVVTITAIINKGKQKGEPEVKMIL